MNLIKIKNPGEVDLNGIYKRSKPKTRTKSAVSSPSSVSCVKTPAGESQKNCTGTFLGYCDGILNILFCRNTGDLKALESGVYILAAAGHREEGFECRMNIIVENTSNKLNLNLIKFIHS